MFALAFLLSCVHKVSHRTVQYTLIGTLWLSVFDYYRCTQTCVFISAVSTEDCMYASGCRNFVAARYTIFEFLLYGLIILICCLFHVTETAELGTFVQMLNC